MNDFVRENLDLSPFKVCIAVLLKVRFLRSTAAVVAPADLGKLDDVLVDFISSSDVMPPHFQDVIAVLQRSDFDSSDELISAYNRAVCFHFIFICVNYACI